MTVEWTVFAMAERENIFDYIEADSPRAAIALDNRIESSVDALEPTPEIGRPGRVSGTRELVIRKTQFIAAYRIEEDVVKILRSLHGAQSWPESLEPARG